MFNTMALPINGSGIKNGQLYKVSYLPKSHRAIIIKKEEQFFLIGIKM